MASPLEVSVATSEGISALLPRFDRNDVVLGTSALGSIEVGGPIFDAYVERGGRGFDVACIYGQQRREGCCEETLGTWLAGSGMRDQVRLYGKGAHPPCCSPDLVEGQARQSLERLQTDRFDVYMVHRDDPSVPVGEFVDALDALISSGLTLSYGMSNWQPARFEAATAYALEAGRVPPAMLSNQFSLAEMVTPVYEGCVCSGDEDAWRWHRAHPDVSLLAWSSQARGLFARASTSMGVGLGVIEDVVWRSPQNEVRLDHARQLAADRQVDPVQVALAWVLGQPFSVLPVVGPRTVAEVRNSMLALSVDLSDVELSWLRGPE